MRLPAPLSRRNAQAHKNQFGHVLILAGSGPMLGAGALSSLAAMRSGAGLVTLGVPKSLNAAAQKKISSVVMTFPLKETREQTIAHGAFDQIKNRLERYQAIAIGPGLSQNSDTQKFVLQLITKTNLPLVIDADALNALAQHLPVLTKQNTPKILTPHPGEMSRLTGLSCARIEANRDATAKAFAKQYRCVLLLKGPRTVVAGPDGKIYINKTGNSGMATAGSGDVLTGMIAAFLAQGLSAFEAAKWGAYLHGKAGDTAAKKKFRTALIATDIIDAIPLALKSSGAA